MSAKYVDERLSLPANYVSGKIGVVTVLYNSASVLEDFFASIEQQTYTNYVVYCVDNASSDTSVLQCRSRDSRYVVIENGLNLGVAAGNNIGTRSAVSDECEFVLYLNNDVVFGPTLFADLVEGLSLYSCSMTTPMMYYYDQPEVIWAAGGHFQPLLGYRCQHLRHGEIETAEPAAVLQVNYSPTCCVLVRRELFAEIGLMDERYFAYYDDTDFMLRAYREKKRLFLLPYAKLWHKVSSLTGADSPFRVRYLTRNQALYHHKNVTMVGAWLISTLYCTYYLVMWLGQRLTREEALARLNFWKDGIRLAYKVQE